MEKQCLGQLIGEIDHLMEQTKWQSKIADKEKQASAERNDILGRGASALLLLRELFGEKAEEVPEYEKLREIVQTIDAVVATLPVRAQALVTERYGLGIEPVHSDVEVSEDRNLHWVLRLLRRPPRSRKLKRLVGSKG